MKIKFLKKKFTSFLIVAALLAGLIASVVLIKERQIIKKKAVSESATLSLLPSSYNFAFGDVDTFTLELWASFTNGSSSEKLTYFKTRINFPNEFFELAEPIDVSPSGLNQIIRVEIPSIANETGIIYIQIGAVSDNDERPSTKDAMKIAVMKFRPKKTSGGSKEFTIMASQSQLVNNERPTPVSISLNNPRNASVNVFDQNLADTCSCGDEGILENNYCVSPKEPVCTTEGGCQCVFSTETTEPSIPPDTVSSTTAPTSAPILTPPETEEPTVPSGTPVVSFRFKLRSVDSDVGRLSVIVRVRKDSLLKEYRDVAAIHQADGVYKVDNLALIDIPAGTGYKIFVKGPKHLSKGFSVNLVAGSNSVFDWTAEPLEPGDLPPQDGVVNAFDISRVIELLGKANPTDEELSAADLNYDGVINGGDTNELILTLSTKYDEDFY